MSKLSRGDNPKSRALNRRNMLLGGTTLAAASAIAAGEPVQLAQAQAQPAAASGQKPNIVVIWGDDIGSHQSQRLLARPDGLPHAEHRPHRQRGHDLHRLLRRAKLHGRPLRLHHRPERASAPACPRSACRAPTLGLQKEDPTIAELLKPLGYATGQFGKNHLGDRNEFLPTVHGFDEFYGNLYHLNAEEEPELPDYPNPKDFPNFRENFGPRGVLALHWRPTWTTRRSIRASAGRQAKDRGHRAADQEADGDDRRRLRRPRRRFHRSGRPRPDKPFFVWVNFTHMHFRTHAEARQRRAGRPLAETLITT